jgi:sulfatase modifying factor 1
MMGSPKDEEGRRRDETQHKVTLARGFYLGVHTVTQEQWQLIMGANPSYHKGEKDLPVDSVSGRTAVCFGVRAAVARFTHGVAASRAA